MIYPIDVLLGRFQFWRQLRGGTWYKIFSYRKLTSRWIRENYFITRPRRDQFILREDYE